MKKMLGTLITCLLMVGGMMVLAIGPAGAHTPLGGADCSEGVWAKGTNYSSSNTNTLTVSVDDTVKTLEFTVNGNLSLPIPQDGVQHSWSWKVDTTNSNSAYKASNSGKITCGTPPDTSSQSITFCHATSSETNPYNLITTNVHAFYQAGHVDHAGDIFPAGSYTKNQQTFSWGAQGDQSLLSTGCKPPAVLAKDATVTITVVPPTCDTAGSASYTTVHSHLIGTFQSGAGSHVASFEADEGHLFSGNETVVEKSYDVAPATGDCPVPVQYNAPAAPTPPTCDTAGSFTLPVDTEFIDWSIAPTYNGAGTYTVTATLIGDLPAWTDDFEGRARSAQVVVAGPTGYQSTDAQAPCYRTPPTETPTPTPTPTPPVDTPTPVPPVETPVPVPPVETPTPVPPVETPTPTPPTPTVPPETPQPPTPEPPSNKSAPRELPSTGASAASDSPMSGLPFAGLGLVAVGAALLLIRRHAK